MRFKKILAVLMTVVIAFVFSVPCYANSENHDDEVSPLYSIAICLWSNISISGTTAICESYASGLSTKVSSIKVVQTLQKQWLLGAYLDISGASWTKTVSARSITISGSKTGLGSGTYRVKAVFTFTAKDGTTETITICSEPDTI